MTRAGGCRVRLVRVALGLWLLALAAVGIGALVQYALAAAATPGASVPLLSTFNAAFYQFDYVSQGFIKRGLPGTLLAGLDGPARQGAAAWVGAGVLVLLCTMLVDALRHCRTRLARGDFVLLAVLWLAAPTGLINLGYDIGRPEHINALLLAGALYAQSRGRTAMVCLATVLALLIHEAFVFYGLPVLCIRAWVGSEAHAGRGANARARALLGPGLAAATTLAVLWRWGRFEAGRTALVDSLGGRVSASHNVLNVWLRSLGDNVGYVSQRWSQGLFGPFELGLLVVLVGAGLGLVWAIYRSNRAPMDGLALVPLAILPLFALGVDYARWVGLFWLMVTTVITLGVLDGRFTRLLAPPAAAIAAAALLASMLLGPLGTVHPFPLIAALWPGS